MDLYFFLLQGEEMATGVVPAAAAPAGAVPMALQFALNRLFVVTANMGSVFEDVSWLGSLFCYFIVDL